MHIRRSSHGKRAYKPTAYDKAAKPMRVFDVPPNLGRIARREALSQIRAAIHRATELQITERHKAARRNRKADDCETCWQHLRENRRNHGRLL
jgi:hypothetical protein